MRIRNFFSIVSFGKEEITCHNRSYLLKSVSMHTIQNKIHDKTLTAIIQIIRESYQKQNKEILDSIRSAGGVIDVAGDGRCKNFHNILLDKILDVRLPAKRLLLLQFILCDKHTFRPS